MLSMRQWGSTSGHVDLPDGRKIDTGSLKTLWGFDQGNGLRWKLNPCYYFLYFSIQ